MLSAMFLTGCANEFNQVYKTSDYSYKYCQRKELARHNFAARLGDIAEGNRQRSRKFVYVGYGTV